MPCRFAFIILLFVLLINPNLSFARTIKTGIQSDIEPIVGYERVQKLVPAAHTKDRLVYGARAWLGIPIISIETEYLHSTDTEVYSTMTTVDTDQKAKLGLRSQIKLSSLLSFVARAGAQAKQTKHDETTGGVTTSTTTDFIYKPYAGAGFHMRLAKHVALTAEIVAVFANYPTSWTDNEYQTTAGLTIHFP